MTKVEYNADLMHNAIQKLMDAKQNLRELDSQVEIFDRVRCPGGAKETHAFHKKLANTTLPNAISRHGNMMKMLDEKIAGLVAIDREYNNGEVANALGFKVAN